MVRKTALTHHAAAVILAHNHPSGVTSSRARRTSLLTRRLRDALALVEVRVVDHLIVGEPGAFSFAERSLI